MDNSIANKHIKSDSYELSLLIVRNILEEIHLWVRESFVYHGLLRSQHHQTKHNIQVSYSITNSLPVQPR